MNEPTKRVIALGFFDGVHLGHGALLRRTLERAAEQSLTPSVLSFDTPPCKGAPMLTSPADRADLLRRLYGIDDLLFLHFDASLRHMGWADFVSWLAGEFGAAWLVAGYDFRFGYRGAGDAEKLAAKCASLGLGCDIVPQVSLDGGAVSSTRVRELLTKGDLPAANRLLGHPHVLTDTVRTGFRLGRRLGFPTINMRFEEGVLVPRHGVYAARAFLPHTGEDFAAVTNIGVRPTVGGKDAVTAESHLLDFQGSLYGRRVRLELLEFLRDEQKFQSVDELQAQISQDVLAVRKLMGLRD